MLRISALPSFPNIASNEGFFAVAGSFSEKISVIASFPLNGSCSSTITNLIAAFFPLPTNLPVTDGFTGGSSLAGVCAAANPATNSAIKAAENCQDRRGGKVIMGWNGLIDAEDFGWFARNLRASDQSPPRGMWVAHLERVKITPFLITQRQRCS